METSQAYNYFPPVDQLLTYREPGIEKAEDWPDYLQLGLGSEHIPELIRMATDQSLIEVEAEGEESNRSWGGPIHAWRALGQLHAKAAIEPLLSLFRTQKDNDWVMEELPDVFGMIGPTLLELTRSAHPGSPRVGVFANRASCLLWGEKVARGIDMERAPCLILHIWKRPIPLAELRGAQG